MPRAARDTERSTQLPRIIPQHGSRVVYDADMISDSEDPTGSEFLDPLDGGYGKSQLKARSSSTAELGALLPRTSPQNTLFRLNLDGARRRVKSKSHPAASGSTPPTCSEALKHSPSCPHLAKSVEAVRSARLPNISVPCTRLIRNLVKNTRSPGSAGAKGKEPYFEIVTPAIFDLSFEGVLGKEDEPEGDGSSDNGSVLLIEREMFSSQSGSNTRSPDSPNVGPRPDDVDSYYDATSALLPNPYSRPASPEPLSRGESSSNSPLKLRDSAAAQEPPPRSTSLPSWRPPPRSASLPSQRTADSTPHPNDTSPIPSVQPASAPPTTTTTPNAPLSSPSLATIQRKKPRPLPVPPAHQQVPTRSRTTPLPLRPGVDRNLPPIPVS